MSQGAEVIVTSNKGFASVVNVGLSHIHEDHVLIVNDDTVTLTPNWDKLVTAHFDAGIGAVGAVSNLALRHQTAWPANQATKVPTLSFFWVAINRAVLDSVGALDEAFDPGYWEDIDWSIRARKAGWELIVDHRIFVWHWGSQTVSRMSDVDWEAVKARNEELVRVKHADFFAQETINLAQEAPSYAGPDA